MTAVHVSTIFCVTFIFLSRNLGTSNLQELVVPILNRNTQCNAANAHNGRMLQSMFCAGNLFK